VSERGGNTTPDNLLSDDGVASYGHQERLLSFANPSVHRAYTDVDLAAYTLDRSKFGDGRVLARIVSYEAFIEYASFLI